MVYAVNYVDMGFAATKQRCESLSARLEIQNADGGLFSLVAGISTDTGHTSSTVDGSWGGPHNDVCADCLFCVAIGRAY